ncbi:snare protein [Cystoisospora suis]|uniref:Snare protein n=1 Tax=Cystoisospora suis TaxID=483139 RepID=A0A2C6LBT9_9APIC|nr:snare protein [Cystoisospora suis]
MSTACQSSALLGRCTPLAPGVLSFRNHKPWRGLLLGSGHSTLFSPDRNVVLEDGCHGTGRMSRPRGRLRTAFLPQGSLRCSDHFAIERICAGEHPCSTSAASSSRVDRHVAVKQIGFTQDTPENLLHSSGPLFFVSERRCPWFRDTIGRQRMPVGLGVSSAQCRSARSSAHYQGCHVLSRFHFGVPQMFDSRCQRVQKRTVSSNGRLVRDSFCRRLLETGEKPGEARPACQTEDVPVAARYEEFFTGEGPDDSSGSEWGTAGTVKYSQGEQEAAAAATTTRAGTGIETLDALDPTKALSANGPSYEAHEVYVNPICMQMDLLVFRCGSAEEVLSLLVSHRGVLFLQNLITALDRIADFANGDEHEHFTKLPRPLSSCQGSDAGSVSETSQSLDKATAREPGTGPNASSAAVPCSEEVLTIATAREERSWMGDAAADEEPVQGGSGKGNRLGGLPAAECPDRGQAIGRSQEKSYRRDKDVDSPHRQTAPRNTDDAISCSPLNWRLEGSVPKGWPSGGCTYRDLFSNLVSGEREEGAVGRRGGGARISGRPAAESILRDERYEVLLQDLCFHQHNLSFEAAARVVLALRRLGHRHYPLLSAMLRPLARRAIAFPTLTQSFSTPISASVACSVSPDSATPQTEKEQIATSLTKDQHWAARGTVTETRLTCPDGKSDSMKSGGTRDEGRAQKFEAVLKERVHVLLRCAAVYVWAGYTQHPFFDRIALLLSADLEQGAVITTTGPTPSSYSDCSVFRDPHRTVPPGSSFVQRITPSTTHSTGQTPQPGDGGCAREERYEPISSSSCSSRLAPVFSNPHLPSRRVSGPSVASVLARSPSLVVEALRIFSFLQLRVGHSLFASAAQIIETQIAALTPTQLVTVATAISTQPAYLACSSHLGFACSNPRVNKPAPPFPVASRRRVSPLGSRGYQIESHRGVLQETVAIDTLSNSAITPIKVSGSLLPSVASAASGGSLTSSFSCSGQGRETAEDRDGGSPSDLHARPGKKGFWCHPGENLAKECGPSSRPAPKESSSCYVSYSCQDTISDTTPGLPDRHSSVLDPATHIPDEKHRPLEPVSDRLLRLAALRVETAFPAFPLTSIIALLAAFQRRNLYFPSCVALTLSRSTPHIRLAANVRQRAALPVDDIAQLLECCTFFGDPPGRPLASLKAVGGKLLGAGAPAGVSGVNLRGCPAAGGISRSLDIENEEDSLSSSSSLFSVPERMTEWPDLTEEKKELCDAAAAYLEQHLDEVSERAAMQVTFAFCAVEGAASRHSYVLSFMFRKIGKGTEWEKDKVRVFHLWLCQLLQFPWLLYNLPRRCVFEGLRAWCMRRGGYGVPFAREVAEVSALLTLLRVRHETSVPMPDGPYELDIVLAAPGLERAVILITSECAANTSIPAGGSVLQQRHLELAGFVQVAFLHRPTWRCLRDPGDKLRFLVALLQRLYVSSPPSA